VLSNTLFVGTIYTFKYLLLIYSLVTENAFVWLKIAESCD